jgi:plasmid stabilization system protein ParE
MVSNSSPNFELDVKLRIGKKAQRQTARIEQWWVQNRAAQAALFIDELEATFRHICNVRIAGVGWPTPRHPTLRRILMPRSQNHLYFVIDERSQTVDVLAIWGAPRGTTPKL